MYDTCVKRLLARAQLEYDIAVEEEWLIILNNHDWHFLEKHVKHDPHFHGLDGLLKGTHAEMSPYFSVNSWKDLDLIKPFEKR